jgi:hypothetical protein
MQKYLISKKTALVSINLGCVSHSGGYDILEKSVGNIGNIVFTDGVYSHIKSPSFVGFNFE